MLRNLELHAAGLQREIWQEARAEGSATVVALAPIEQHLARLNQKVDVLIAQVARHTEAINYLAKLASIDVTTPNHLAAHVQRQPPQLARDSAEEVTSRKLISLMEPALLQNAGIPFRTVNAARWAFRRRTENGLEGAFVRIGRNVFVDVARFHELASKQKT